LSVPIYDFAIANQELANRDIEFYYPCCGKNICKGCWYSKGNSGHSDKFKCPFCNSEGSKTDQEQFEKIMKRVEANDPTSMFVLAHHYYNGLGAVQQNRERALELLTRSADLGCNKAHNNMGLHYFDGGDMKTAKFHYEAAAMAGHVLARNNVGIIEANSGNMERAVKNWRIAAAGGEFYAMHSLQMMFEDGLVNRETMHSTLTAYNNSCAEMRSEARDSFIRSQSNTN
jgi:TPR repeat protein